MTEMTAQEMLDEVGRRGDTEFAADVAGQARDKDRYDPVRAQARLRSLMPAATLHEAKSAGPRRP